jgi:small-conductance mechanosensitive channel
MRYQSANSVRARSKSAPRNGIFAWCTSACCLFVTAQAFAQNSPEVTASAKKGPNAATKQEPQAEPPKRTEAEKITNIRNLLESDEQRQGELGQELEQLQGEFDHASSKFSEVDERLTTEREKLEGLPESEQPKQRAALEELEKERLQARDKFDLVIARRKAVQQQLETIREKIGLVKEALERATSADDSPPDAANESTPPPSGLGPSAVDKTEDAADTHSAVERVSLAISGGQSIATSVASVTEPTLLFHDKAALYEGFVDDRLIAARKVRDTKQAAVVALEKKRRRLDRAIDVMQRDLESSRQLLETSNREAHSTEQECLELDAKLNERYRADAGEAELAELSKKRNAALRDFAEAQRDANEQARRVTQSEEQLKRVEKARATAAEMLDAARTELDTAKQNLWFYESPFSPHQVRIWAIKSGPRMLSVLAVMFSLWWLTRLLGKRLVATLVAGTRRGSQAEREGRAETLRRVFQSAARVAIIIIGTLALFQQAGIDITVLLGGAAVVGAAIALSSQNLIRDYFSGFMILLENQYSVGNVIRIAEASGSVEDITLRMTVLRDEEGVVHFIPHGQVNQVSNLTHGWSRAVFNVRVSHDEDTARVMDLLMDLARELRNDPQFGPQTLGDPEMLGVDSFDDAAVVIKFLIKTRPLKQSNVKREMLRRIKLTFDKHGIKLSNPQKTVLVHQRVWTDTKAVESPSRVATGDSAAIRRLREAS